MKGLEEDKKGSYKRNWPKFIVGFIVCMLVRLIPFRPPNIEPVLATQMPFSKAYGAWAGFLFAFLNIVLYDLVTGKLGVWTLLTAGTYGVLGLWAVFYFKNKSGSHRRIHWNDNGHRIAGESVARGLRTAYPKLFPEFRKEPK